MINNRPVGLQGFPTPSPVTQHTAVVFILDASGSMLSIKQQAIDHFNEAVDMLEKHMNGAGTCSVSLITFNDLVTPVFWDQPVSGMSRLNSDQYHPNGMTAMVEAIAQGINHMESRYAGRDNVAFLFNIVTDGLNNRIYETSSAQLSKMIQERQNRGNWTFTFAGANIDIEALGREYHIPFGNTQSWQATPAGMRSMSVSTSAGIARYASARGAGGQSIGNLYSPDNAQSPDETQEEQAVT